MARPKKVIHPASSFIRNTPHDLMKLLRSLNKESQNAVNTLVELLTCHDPKVKLGAAEKLLTMQKDVAESINKDNLQRMIAQLRLNPNTDPEEMKAISEEEDAPKMPMVDFTTVQFVDGN